mmetsp:Transcript_39051/g.85614  ORF Transcript_39051/g.85614 Transcript_39051/m.85614 type:complete len:118 (-) Transcript_39051:68-421(-)
MATDARCGRSIENSETDVAEQALIYRLVDEEGRIESHVSNGSRRMIYSILECTEAWANLQIDYGGRRNQNLTAHGTAHTATGGTVRLYSEKSSSSDTDPISTTSPQFEGKAGRVMIQ